MTRVWISSVPGLLVALLLVGCGTTRTVTRTQTVTATRSPANVWVNPSSALTVSAVRDPMIFNFSADGSAYARIRSWASWTAAAATATATMELNDCTPSCAQGHFAAYRGLLVLSDPQPCREYRLLEFRVATFIPDPDVSYPRDAQTSEQPLACAQPPAGSGGRPIAVPLSPPKGLTAAQRRTFAMGETVVMQTGCEGCHQIGTEGNNGPGPPLTHIGTRRNATAIAAALTNPTAPMPSFEQLAKTSPRKFHALVQFLAMLR